MSHYTMDKDKLAAEVVNRLLDALPDNIFGDMRMGDWHDPYGEMMAWWFALNDACVALDYLCHESFVPSPFGPDDDDYRYDILITNITANVDRTDHDQIAGWHKLFNTAHHALELLGKDY